MSTTIEGEARVVGLRAGDCYIRWYENRTQGWSQEQLENLASLAKDYPLDSADNPPPEGSEFEIPYRTLQLVHSRAANIAQNNPGMSRGECVDLAWEEIFRQCSSEAVKSSKTVNCKKKIGDWGVRRRIGRSISSPA